MPAILEDAFSTPFRRGIANMGSKTKDVDTSSTTSLHNPYFDAERNMPILPESLFKQTVAQKQTQQYSEPVAQNQGHGQGHSPANFGHQFTMPVSQWYGQNSQSNHAGHYAMPSHETHHGGGRADMHPIYHPSPNHGWQIAQPYFNTNHNCDRLLALVLSCASCRERLRQIYHSNSNGSEGRQMAPGTGSDPSHGYPPPSSQHGGGLSLPSFNPAGLTATTIGNFIFGIAVIFVIDRIIRLR